MKVELVPGIDGLYVKGDEGKASKLNVSLMPGTAPDVVSMATTFYNDVNAIAKNTDDVETLKQGKVPEQYL